MTDAVEAVARAMRAARYGPVAEAVWKERWARIEKTDPYLPRQARAAIAAHKAALREAGLVIVPRRPTEAMYEAGGSSEPFGGAYEKWKPGQIVAGTVWRAMVAAALGETEDTTDA